MRTAIIAGIWLTGVLRLGMTALETIGGSNSGMGMLPATPAGILSRHYAEGEKLTYHMTGSNQEWRYAIDANGTAKKDAGGKFYEEYEWSGMISDGAAYALPEASQKFRQKLSLEPDVSLSVPDLSHVDAKIIGPITDLLTIYSDLWLANKMGNFFQGGRSFLFQERHGKFVGGRKLRITGARLN